MIGSCIFLNRFIRSDEFRLTRIRSSVVAVEKGLDEVFCGITALTAVVGYKDAYMLGRHKIQSRIKHGVRTTMSDQREPIDLFLCEPKIHPRQTFIKLKRR
ncbi:hypothetical protein D3C71_1416790 [compost metagenome]